MTISRILKGFKICQWYHFKPQLMLSLLIYVIYRWIKLHKGRTWVTHRKVEKIPHIYFRNQRSCTNFGFGMAVGLWEFIWGGTFSDIKCISCVKVSLWSGHAKNFSSNNKGKYPLTISLNFARLRKLIGTCRWSNIHSLPTYRILGILFPGNKETNTQAISLATT